MRVIAYIDGFNLYYGLKSKKWERYLWLDVQALCQNLLKPDQTLTLTKFFTARISAPPDKVKRQSTYLDAIQTLPNTSIHLGHFLESIRKCRKCGYTYPVQQEKMTDVNIASELLEDAFRDGFDMAVLISADSDLIAPVKTVRRLFPQKRIIVASPPGRFSFDLTKAAHAYLRIGHGTIEKSQFPEELKTASGFTLHRPASWR
jgi:NYN domain-containing protein